MKMSDATKIKMLAKLRIMSMDRKINDKKYESTMKIYEINNEVCRKEDKWHKTKSEQKKGWVQQTLHKNVCTTMIMELKMT